MDLTNDIAGTNRSIASTLDSHYQLLYWRVNVWITGASIQHALEKDCKCKKKNEIEKVFFLSFKLKIILPVNFEVICSATFPLFYQFFTISASVHCANSHLVMYNHKSGDKKNACIATILKLVVHLC